VHITPSNKQQNENVNLPMSIVEAGAKAVAFRQRSGKIVQAGIGAMSARRLHRGRDVLL
jgi:hypothetical protein